MMQRDYTFIYLHGFLSSPQSIKARQTQVFFSNHYPHIRFIVPSISHYPDIAINQLRTLVAKHEKTNLRFIGSSMGGFLATNLVNQFGGKAVLINPAVEPHVLLEGYLGEHQNPYTEDVFWLEAKHITVLKNLLIDVITVPKDFWVLLQTDDETLDYRQAANKYQHSKLTIEQGGDHSFVGYEAYLDEIAKFLLD